MNKGYLLDTSVVSALAPGRETFVPAALREWLQAHHQALFLPSIAIAEMAQGIGKLRRAGSAERADRLDAWLDGLLATYADRILPLTPRPQGWLGKCQMPPWHRAATPVLPMWRLRHWPSMRDCCC